MLISLLQSISMNFTDQDGTNHSPAIFGEVLFDCFPNNLQVLGGAPFNVAWHLQGLGKPPLFISRIGSDPLGDEILRKASEWHMNTEGIQIDDSLPTGQVLIEFHGNTHSFDILNEQAYDHIQQEPVLNLLQDKKPEILYFGSLIMRNPQSRATLDATLAHINCPCFVDINLREPWCNERILGHAMQAAYWLKLNEQELALITGKSCEDPDSIYDNARGIMEKYNIHMVIVTRGNLGAMLVIAGEAIHAEAAEIRQLKDTVGAGDAFSAVCIYGLSRNWPYEQILKRASAFAASICEIQGATTNDRHFYARHLSDWQQE